MDPSQLISLPVWLVVLFLVGGFVWYLFQKHFEYTLTRKTAMEEKLAERRQKLYDSFMNDYWGKIVDGKLRQGAAQAFLQKWSRDAWLVSSDDVIRGMMRLQAGAANQAEMMVVSARLFLAMRKDMGNPTSLKEREFLRSLIKGEDWPLIEDWLKVSIPNRLRGNTSRPSLADEPSQTS